MNAYELADDLAFKHIAGDDSGAYGVKLQDMLRQQADRIAELEQRPAINKDDGLVCAKCYSPLYTTPQDQADRIAELEKAYAELHHKALELGLKNPNKQTKE